MGAGSRRHRFIVLGVLAASALLAALLTVLLALEQTPLILMVMVGVLIVVIIAEIVLYLVGRSNADSEPIEAEIIETESG